MLVVRLFLQPYCKICYLSDITVNVRMSEYPPDETTVPDVLLVKPVFWISPGELTVLNVLLVFCLHLSS